MSTTTASPSERVLRKRARVREHLLAAAAELVREVGVNGLTIEAVAARADVSKPAVYYYFASKDALTRALALDRSRDEIATLREAITNIPPGSSVIEAVVRAYVTHHLASLSLFRAEYVWAQIVGLEGDDLDAAVNDEMNALFTLFEERLREDAARRLLHDGLHLRRVAVTTWASAHGIVAMLSLLDAGGTKLLHDVTDMVDELCQVLTRGVYRRVPARRSSAPRLPARRSSAPRPATSPAGRG